MCNCWFRASRWLLVVVCVFLMTSAASAQIHMERYSNDDNGILQWGVALGILLLLGGVGMMNPKRTHQD